MLVLSLLLALAAPLAAVAKDSRTFAVLHFHGDKPLTRGRTDPIVNPGGPSSHVHVVQGGNAFSNSATGESMTKSTCSTANLKADKSAYWMPALYFQDPQNGSFEAVPLFYMNVYYFFEPTNDKIESFPLGLQMVSGNASKSTPPAMGNNVLDPSQGTVQPAQFTCPRSSFDPPSYPPDSDGSVAGIQDTGNKGSGAGFPFAECDGYASPLRADLHFPSCYNPEAGLTAYQTNMQFPTDAGDGKQDCPAGWVHTPHIFYEMYWNTPLFVDRWTPGGDSQPFVLANGDTAGYSLHGDFLAAWDTDVLQHVIDTCDAGDAGMDKCEGVETVLEGNCSIDNPTAEQIDGELETLPGNNPLFGWKHGGMSSSGSEGTTTATPSKTSSTSSSSSSSSSTFSSSSSTSASSTSASSSTSTSSSSSSLAPSFSSSTSSSSSAISFEALAAQVTSVDFSSTPVASHPPLPYSLGLTNGSSTTTSTVTLQTTITITKRPVRPSARPLPSYAGYHYLNTTSPASADPTAPPNCPGTGLPVLGHVPSVPLQQEESTTILTFTDTVYSTVTDTRDPQEPTTIVTRTATSSTTTTLTRHHQTTVLATGSPLAKREYHLRRHKRHH